MNTDVQGIGRRAVGGYSLEALRSVIDRALSFERKFSAVMEQEDALEMTEDVVVQVVRLGWEEERVRDFAANGYRYSPSRNTMLSPIVTSDDDPGDYEEDDDSASEP